jgi:ADP-ribose pyrophosphatase YjhB (NUDIX family)
VNPLELSSVAVDVPLLAGFLSATTKHLLGPNEPIRTTSGAIAGRPVTSEIVPRRSRAVTRPAMGLARATVLVDTTKHGARVRLMTTRTREAKVPPGYDPSTFPAFAVTVDMVILTMVEGVLNALLVRRGQEPFEGMWATPGGFKRPDETLDEAARRELAEETGVDVPSLLTQFGAYGDPGRDPRMNVVTVGYLAVLRDVGAITAGTDAAHAALVPVSDILEERLELAFDHLGIVRDAVERVRLRWHDLHDGRAPGGVRGDLGRSARRRELPPKPRRRGRLGDSNGPDRPAREGRREAGGAVSRRRGVEARRSHPEEPTRTTRGAMIPPRRRRLTGTQRHGGTRHG